MSDEMHVVFGTGAVGTAVIEELIKREKRIRAVNRHGQAAHLAASVEVVSGDATNADRCREVCQGATHVYNCTNPPYDKHVELFPLLQAGVLAGAAAHDAKLIVMENLYMYGPTHGAPLTEDTPEAAPTRKGKSRAQLHRELMAAHKAGTVRAVSGRASDFFGPLGLNSAVGERVFYPALKGDTIQMLGNLDLPHTYSYTPDVGKGLVILGEHDEALGRAWHLPGPRTVTTREFLSLIMQATGQQCKIQLAPKVLVRIIGLFNPIMRELVEMYYEFDEPFVMDFSQFTAAFGDISTPLEEAVQTTVGWYRDHPQG